MANGNKLIDQKAIDTIIDSILKAVEIKLNKKSSEGRGKDGKDGRDGKNAPQINDDEALSTNPWSGLKTQEEIAKVEGKIYPCTAQALEAMTQEQQAELYAQGYRAIKTENNGTGVLLGLSADGSLEWLGCNQPRGNLLVNSDFAIAQAGYGGLHGTQQYAADRWAQSDGSATFSQASGGGLSIQMSQAGHIYQKLAETPSGNFTLAVNVGGEDYVSAGTWPEGSGAVGIDVVFPGGNIYADVTFGVVIYFASSYTITHARLLRGSYTPKTLPPWEAPDYATEYLKCRRYWRKFDVSSKKLIGACFYPNAVAVIGGVLDVPMRAIPTCHVETITSIDAGTTYDILSYIAGPDGAVWIAISGDTPIQIGTYVYITDLQFSCDL